MKIIKTDASMEAKVQSIIKTKLAEMKKQDRFTMLNVSVSPKELLGFTDKAQVGFTRKAWEKMKAIVDVNVNQEAAWHGTVVKKGKGKYLVKDMYCYPQKVTGATVESDDDKYPQWMQELPDEVYNNIHFQGHSHVNFAANPSSVDINNWEEFYKIIPEDSFYIFMIMNKAGNHHIQIVDKADNVILENTDIEVGVAGEDYKTWAKEQLEEFIVKKTFAPTYTVGSIATGFNTNAYYQHTNYSGAQNNPNKKDKKNKKDKRNIRNLLRG